MYIIFNMYRYILDIYIYVCMYIWKQQRIPIPGIPWATPTLLCIFGRRSLVEQTLGKLIPG